MKSEKLYHYRVDVRIYDPMLMVGPKKEEGEEHGVATKTRNVVKRPKRFKVILHNDDYTTMEFVIFILQKVFFKSGVEAQEIMLKIHNEGAGVCGVYIHEVAETKIVKVNSLSKENGHPLRCSLEEE